MAKVSENSINDLTQDWGLDPENKLPFSGGAVQEFIKKTFNTKMGVFHYDESNNRYIVFADEASRDKYLEDTTLTDLVLGTFDAPFNYTAEIKLISDTYVAVPFDASGNYIEFTFDVKNKNGQSIGEDVICTYTIMRGTTKKVVTQKYRYGSVVRFNIDEYIEEGTNRITIGIVGQSTLAATTVGVTYQVVDLNLTDETNISEVYDMATGVKTLSIPFTVSGYGIKTVEWYLDGEKIEFDKVVDEVVDVSSSRVKYITLSNMSRGTHYVEFAAYTTIEGEKFYTKVCHRDIIIENNPNLELDSSIIAMSYDKATFDSQYVALTQYMAYDLNFAVYNPKSPSETPVNVYVGDKKITTLNVPNGVVTTYSITPETTGNVGIKLTVGETQYTLNSIVAENSMGISEIKAGLEFNFRTIGRSNSEEGRDTWSDGTYNATLTGFNYTTSSGWVGNKLILNNGAAINFDYAPLASGSTALGKTIEFELASAKVSDDASVLCNLIGSNGSGILITASEAKIVSRGGVTLSTRYKSEENNRISFVINRTSGTTNKGLVFIYINGVLSGALNFGSSDDFISTAKLAFNGTESSEVILKQVIVYNTALSSDQILNNYILYRDTVSDMLEVYDRNDIYEEGTVNFSLEKLQGQLPIMIVTGDIPTLENTTNKNTQITVDIDYYNLQDPTRSFTLKNAAMRPQGTSSMLYPKKNFRIYSNKLDSTVLTVNGVVSEDRLYSFTEKAQPVDCWCLKADFAESSGTHNTGMARLWNNLLVNTTLNGEFVFRTEAQKAAIETSYPYDVRTTIDGFPILMFYRRDENSDLIFIGKYNFNNDKSTESVFGFKGIPGFDNSRMQCWEVLNNGDALALFTDVSDFDTRWSEAYESRYPDTSSPDTSDLKVFAQWVNKFNGQQNREVFKNEKWDHLQVHLVAAYYVYLMRFGAVDQVVKNAMLTSEDGLHFFFINYDNDTINGLRNNGVLAFDPTIDRQSLDPATGGLAYAYAGHDSVLWNMLENDTEFMSIVKDVDNALYTSGLRYDNVIRYFDEYQSDKWNERVYNQDAQYKYIGPYTDAGNNNLLMLQGKRQSHRRWWLSKRFSLYDAEFVSGDYKGKAFEFKVINNTEPGWTFTIKAGTKMKYGYGVYNPIESGIPLEIGESHSFTVQQTLNIGDPVRIYSAVNLMGVDLSNILPRLSNIELNNVWDDTIGSKLKELILGNGISTNSILTSISSIAKAKYLEKLDMRGCQGIKSIDLSNNVYLATILALDSGLTGIELPVGAPITELKLPETIQSLRLKQLTQLTTGNVMFGTSSLISLIVMGCPKLSSSMSFAMRYIRDGSLQPSQKTLYIDNILWENVTPDSFILICNAKDSGMNITLKGKVALTASSQEVIERITESFGAQVFNKNNELYISAPDAIYLTGPDSLLEGETGRFTASVFSENYGTVAYSISSGSREGVLINVETGVLTTTENGVADSTLTIRATHTPTVGDPMYVEKQVVIRKRIYPRNITINGPEEPTADNCRYYWTSPDTGISGNYKAEWYLSDGIEQKLHIASSDSHNCILGGDFNVTDEIVGKINLRLLKVVDDSVVASASMNLFLTNPNIAVSKTSNPEVMAVLYANGLCASEDYMTMDEALAITTIQSSMFSRSDIKKFNEFKKFTNVTSLGSSCFNGCRSLTSITIPNSVTSFGYGCFRDCSSLTSITIPNSVTSLGDNCFNNCDSLASIVVEADNPVYDSRESCNAIIESSTNKMLVGCKNSQIPNSVTSLGSSCFNGCRSLTSITIPNSVTSFGYGCFSGCIGLTSITIPNSVTELGDNCFAGCTNINSFDLSSVKSLGDRCFNKCSSLTSVTLNPEISHIPSYCFSETSIDNTDFLPSTVNHIGNGAFHKSNLNTVHLEHTNVVSFGQMAFSECPYLEEVTLPSTLKHLGSSNPYGAFEFCTALKSVEFPNGAEIIDTGTDTFNGCSSLTSIIIPNSSTGKVTIPSSLRTIGDNAFQGCGAITSVVLERNTNSNLSVIGLYAFKGCTNLKTVDLTTISGNSNFTSPINLTAIGDNAFSGCVNLSKLYIPSSVATYVATNAFGNSTSDYTGRNTYNTGENVLYVIDDYSSNYNSGAWVDTLLNSERCGFTLSATLDEQSGLGA